MNSLELEGGTQDIGYPFEVKRQYCHVLNVASSPNYSRATGAGQYKPHKQKTRRKAGLFVDKESDACPDNQRLARLRA
jgi:hypothetical protein